MAFNGIRGKEDEVTLILAGEEVLTSEQYQVKCAILEQPAAFSMRLGTSTDVPKLIKKYPPRTPFQIKINDVVYQTGYVDTLDVTGSVSQVILQGRDVFQDVHDGMVEQEFTVENVSYAKLARKLLDLAGLPDAKLAYTNKANRAAIVGTHVNELEPPRNVEEDMVETESGGLVKRTVQAQLGESIYDFGKRHFDRAGLFLWAAGDGSFVLSEPNPAQAPIYQLFRVDADPAGSNIVDERWRTSTIGRYVEARVYTRGGGRKFGRQPAKGTYTDEEMKRLGYRKKLVLRDVSADTPKKAEFWARRKIAETRRQGWTLEYTVMGHTTVAFSGAKAVWAPDTLVLVNDQKLGIDHEVMYVENVTFERNPHAITKVGLLRLADLVFSDREATAASDLAP